MTDTDYAKMTKAEQKAHREAMLRLARTPMPKEQLDRVLNQRVMSIPSKKVGRQCTRRAQRNAAIREW